MIIKLEFDANGKLDGFQTVTELIGGYSFRESQLFMSGQYDCGSVSVDTGNQVYQFLSSDWGTMDNVRRSSLNWLDNGQNFRYEPSTNDFYTHILVRPVTEEMMVLS